MIQYNLTCITMNTDIWYTDEYVRKVKIKKLRPKNM